MNEQEIEKIKSEFCKKHFCGTAEYTDVVADWWLSHINELLKVREERDRKELIGRIRKMFVTGGEDRLYRQGIKDGSEAMKVDIINLIQSEQL